MASCPAQSPYCSSLAVVEFQGSEQCLSTHHLRGSTSLCPITSLTRFTPKWFTCVLHVWCTMALWLNLLCTVPFIWNEHCGSLRAFSLGLEVCWSLKEVNEPGWVTTALIQNMTICVFFVWILWCWLDVWQHVLCCVALTRLSICSI